MHSTFGPSSQVCRRRVTWVRRNSGLLAMASKVAVRLTTKHGVCATGWTERSRAMLSATGTATNHNQGAPDDSSELWCGEMLVEITIHATLIGQKFKACIILSTFIITLH